MKKKKFCDNKTLQIVHVSTEFFLYPGKCVIFTNFLTFYSIQTNINDVKQ